MRKLPLCLVLALISIIYLEYRQHIFCCQGGESWLSAPVTLSASSSSLALSPCSSPRKPSGKQSRLRDGRLKGHMSPADLPMSSLNLHSRPKPLSLDPKRKKPALSCNQENKSDSALFSFICKCVIHPWPRLHRPQRDRKANVFLERSARHCQRGTRGPPPPFPPFVNLLQCDDYSWFLTGT